MIRFLPPGVPPVIQSATQNGFWTIREKFHKYKYWISEEYRKRQGQDPRVDFSDFPPVRDQPSNEKRWTDRLSSFRYARYVHE